MPDYIFRVETDVDTITTEQLDAVLSWVQPLRGVASIAAGRLVLHVTVQAGGPSDYDPDLPQRVAEVSVGAALTDALGQGEHRVVVR